MTPTLREKSRVFSYDKKKCTKVNLLKVSKKKLIKIFLLNGESLRCAKLWGFLNLSVPNKTSKVAEKNQNLRLKFFSDNRRTSDF